MGRIKPSCPWTVSASLSVLLLLQYSVLPFVSAFSPLSPPFDLFHTRRQPASTTQVSAVNLPPNEFSRTVNPDRVLKRTRSSAQLQRDYHFNITATDEECQALADRFSLPHLESLEAEVSIRRSGSTSDIADDLQIEGLIAAVVTRTCVRTNEDFVESLEMPLLSLVRPVMPLDTLLSKQEQFEEQFMVPSNAKNKKSKKQYRQQDVNDMDVVELQRLLQADIQDEDDILMEDEAIYPLDGEFDVGELIAQLFWLSLDPYPKKPGTDMVQTSITG